MKRFLLAFLIVGGLALMAASQARAQALCGSSYAMQITGADASFTKDGPITAATGIGVLQFGKASGGSCAVTGEIIYNSGDVQSGAPNANGQQSPAGEFFGPSNCFSGASAYGGVPCFDGLDNQLVGGTLSTGGPGGSYILAFAANYSYFDGTDGFDLVTGGPIPFGFYVQTTKSNNIGVGASVVGTPEPYYPGNGAPILNITLQKQTIPVATTWGAAPYLGASALSCTAFGVNSTDGVALAQSLPANGLGQTITGAYESTMGSYDIFSTGQAGGELTFNANDSYVVPSTGAQPNNLECPFALMPQPAIPGLGALYANSGGTPFAIFADGTSNLFATMEPSAAFAPTCTNLLSAGAGYVDSVVQYGTGDVQAYVIVTGLFSDATFFVPVGGMSLCSSYLQSAAPVAFKSKVTTPVKSTGTLTTGPVTIVDNNEVVCDTTTTMAPATATASYSNGLTGSKLQTWDTTCSMALLGGSPTVAGVVGPNPVAQTVAATTCSCTCVDTGTWTGACLASKPLTPLLLPGVVATSTLTVTSAACPISVTQLVTCEN